MLKTIAIIALSSFAGTATMGAADTPTHTFASGDSGREIAAGVVVYSDDTGQEVALLSAEGKTLVWPRAAGDLGGNNIAVIWPAAPTDLDDEEITLIGLGEDNNAGSFQLVNELLCWIEMPDVVLWCMPDVEPMLWSCVTAGTSESGEVTLHCSPQ